MFASLREGLSVAGGRLSAWMKDHRKLCTALAVVVLLAIPHAMVLAQASTAAPAATGDAACTLNSFSAIGCLNNIFTYIIRFEGSVLLFLLDIFISFAQYNSFRDAYPVMIGWTIVRDVVNMFFIIVLLVSAFATIIQYQTGEFHYTKVLPKLLLMAILINFSRTLIGLLIDFSQVVMLTFVNAFKDAAAGNFVTGFGLDKAMQFKQGGTVATQVADPSILMITLILAMVCIAIMIMTVLAMIAFVLVRIIGLWMLMIFSPVAFFATALPGKMQKGLTFTNDYWDNLKGYLVSGPTMAFFLYLTLATIQQATNSNQKMARTMNLFVTSNTDTVSGFASQLGSSDEIATFVIAIAMMWAGLEAGRKSAGSLPGFKSLEGLLQSLPKRGLQVGAVAGGVALGAAALGGRGIQRGVGYANQKLGVTTKLQTAVGKAGLAVVGSNASSAGMFAKMAGAQGRANAEKKKEIMTNARGLKDDPEALYRYRKTLGNSEADNAAKNDIDKMLAKNNINVGERLLQDQKRIDEVKSTIGSGAKAFAGAVASLATVPAAYAVGKASKLGEARSERKEEEAKADTTYRDSVRATNKEYDKKIAATAVPSEKKAFELERMQKLDQASKLRDQSKAIAAGKAADTRAAVVRGIGSDAISIGKSGISAAASVLPSRPRGEGGVIAGAAAGIRGAAKDAGDYGAKYAQDWKSAKDAYTKKLQEIDTEVRARRVSDDDAASMKAAAKREYKADFKALQGGRGISADQAAANVAASATSAASAADVHASSETAGRAAAAQEQVMIEEMRKNLEASLNSAVSAGERGKVQEIEATLKVNPHLATGTDFERVMGTVAKSVDAQKALSPAALKQTAVLEYFIEPHLKIEGDAVKLNADSLHAALPELDIRLQKEIRKHVSSLREAGELS